MVCSPNPGVLDFQDAVLGPITYDLVSLLRDAYVEWDEERELDWAIRYWERARKAGLPVAADFAQFWRDYEWMGVQRQLKVLGIFARLKHRDGKDRYLADMPRVMRYLRRACARYRELDPLGRFLDALEGRPPGFSVFVLRATGCDGNHDAAGPESDDQRDDPGGRARRAHAPADRRHAQAPASCRRQAADRLAGRGPRPRRIHRHRRQRRAPRGNADGRAGGRHCARRAHPLVARGRAPRNRRRRRDGLPAAAPRAGADRLGRHLDALRLCGARGAHRHHDGRSRRPPRTPGDGPQPAVSPGGRFRARSTAGWRWPRATA